MCLGHCIKINYYKSKCMNSHVNPFTHYGRIKFDKFNVISSCCVNDTKHIYLQALPDYNKVKSWTPFATLLMNHVQEVPRNNCTCEFIGKSAVTKYHQLLSKVLKSIDGILHFDKSATVSSSTPPY